MSVELLALLAALCYAGGHIAVKLGSQDGGMIVGFLVSLVAGIVALSVTAAIVLPSWATPDLAIAFFAFAGVAGPGLGRVLAMRGVRDAGTSVAAPIQSSANPVLSSIAGVWLFGETMGLGRVLALALIVAGIASCARGGSANRDTTRASSRLVVLWPLAAGASFALADVLRKFALEEGGEPLLGALLGITTAFVLWFVIFLVSPRLRATARLSRSHGWYAVYGLLGAMGLAALLFALRDGDLSVVIPIFASQPVWVIILGALLLRRLEALRAGTIAGAVLAFAGVAYLALA